MKKLFLSFAIGIFLILLSLHIPQISHSQTTDPCSDPSKFSSLNLDALTNCQNELNQALKESQAATAPLESQLTSMQTQITGIKNRVAAIDSDLTVKKQNIDAGYKNLAKQEQILNIAIADYYINNSYNSPLLTFFSANSAQNMTQIMEYQKAATDQDKIIIQNIALSVQTLEQQKKDLESEEAQLAVVKANLDTQSAKLATIVQGAQAYQATLSSNIATLSNLQQQIVGQKYTSLGIPLYATTTNGCSSDINPYRDPGFSGTKIGFFTYGVANRVGLNQYGSLGRAQAGQSADTILHAYYNFDGYQNVNGITINVNDSNGYGGGNIIWSGSLEDYLKRIYEVPGDWPSEALKAQVIAARSYVLAETNNGSTSICANQHCQVFQTNPKGGAWEQAVNDTAGQAMAQGGKIITAWFSSTHGGYVHSSGGSIGGASWTKDAQDSSGSINSFADLNNNAYDKSSPWFYCDWGSRSSYNNTAWLKPDEVADIANAIMLIQADSGTVQHLSPVDSGDPNMWDENRVKQELQNKGITPFNSVTSVSVSADFGSGRTTGVTITGDAGSKAFSGDTFTTYFDLRAPGNIFIPPFSGSPGNYQAPLFNIEQR